MSANADFWDRAEWRALDLAMKQNQGCSEGIIGRHLLTHFHCWKPMVKINIFYRFNFLERTRLQFWVPVCSVCKFVGKPKKPKFVI